MSEEKRESEGAAHLSRKRFLQRAGAAGAGAMLGGAVPSNAFAAPQGDASTRDESQRLAQAERNPMPNPNDAASTRAALRDHEVNVRSFGAKGDGKTDDTRAFQTAIGALSERGGGTLYVPMGRYLIASHLEIAERVTLRGISESPDPFAAHSTDDGRWGSVLLAVEGRGNADGTPFILMRRHSAMIGMIVLYPEQTRPIPTPYPWCVRGHGDNLALIDCTLVNPYQAVDFGTHYCPRHYIFNLNSHALYRGLFVDECYDIGRVQNVHFWPFWHDDPNIHAWLKENAVAFTFGRTDWQYLVNCFTICYKIGFHFRSFGKMGPGNVLLTQCGADIGPVAVQVDEVMAHAGVTFLNAQIMTRVNVAPGNTGPVKFTGCAFYGHGKSDSHIVSEGNGRVSVDNCHFTWIDGNTGAPAIVARGGTLGVANCEFSANGGGDQIVLEEGLRAANIVGCHFRGTRRIKNTSRAQVQETANTDEAPPPPVALRRRFYSGFENGQPQPILNRLEIGTPGEYSLRVENGGRSANASRIGRALVLSGAKTERESGQSATYFRIYEVNLPVRADTILRYWMRAGSDEARRSGLDLVLDGAKASDEGKSLRHVASATDLEGIHPHPAAARGEVGKWVRVESSIGKWLAGRTITAIIAAHDGRGKEAFRVAFDDIEIGEPAR